jgi:hypothetical protein
MATWWFGDGVVQSTLSPTASDNGTSSYANVSVISTADFILAPKKVHFPPRPRPFPSARAPPPLREQGHHQGKEHAVEARG